MFGVEHKARVDAENTYNELRDRGVSPDQAERQARRQEAKQVKQANAWIKENVGLD